MNAASSDPRLTVVQAPSGYGKTTRLRKLTERFDLPVSWIDAATADNEPLELARRLTGALAPLVRRPLPAPSGDLPTLMINWVPELVNVLQAPGTGDLLLVIDRFERLIGDEVNELIGRVLEAFPPELQTLIGTRRKPKLRLARLLASGEVATIGPVELALDAAAIERTFALAGGAELDHDELATVALWSRGWPVAVQFAARAWAAHHPAQVQARNPAGLSLGELLGEVADGDLAGYVERDVLADLGDGGRRLLLALAASDRTAIGLANTLADEIGDRGLIRALRDESGLVTTLDREGQWLAVLPALRRPLVALLERSEDGGERIVRARTGAWFEQQGMIEEAIEQAASIEDADTVARLLSEHAVELVSEQHLDALRIALGAAAQERLPAGLKPALRLILSAADGGSIQRMVGELERITAAHGANPDVTALTATLLASPSRGDVQAAIRAGTDALARIGPDHGLRGYIVSLLGFSLMLNGDMACARSLLQRVISSKGPVPRQVVAYAALALLEVDEDDLQLAEPHARAAVDLCVPPGEVVSVYASLAHVSLAEAQRLAGRLVLARESLDEARAMVWPGSLRHGLVLVIQARLALAERRRGAARQHADRARELLAGFPDPGAWLLAQLAAVDSALEPHVDDPQPGSMPTPAELRVLEQLFVYNTRGEIAHQLHLSEQTVKAHLRRLYRRLGVSNREDALVAARARGLGPDGNLHDP